MLNTDWKYQINDTCVLPPWRLCLFSNILGLHEEKQQDDGELSRERKITSLQHRHSGETSQAQNKTPLKRSAILIYHPQSNMADTLRINSLHPSLCGGSPHPCNEKATLVPTFLSSPPAPHPCIFLLPGSGMVFCCIISTDGRMKTLSVSSSPPQHIKLMSLLCLLFFCCPCVLSC